MEDIHLRLQADLVWLTWIAFFIALPFYHFIRQRDPLIRWHEHGNVLTKPYGIWDLCGVVVFFMGMTALVSLEGEESAELTTNVLLTGSLMNIAIVCFSFSLALMCFVCVSIMNYEDFQKKAITKKVE